MTMELISKKLYFVCLLVLFGHTCDGAKINTPRVLLPWFENLVVDFTFEIIEGGCYTWSLSRDDIIELEPIYDDSWRHCSRAARVSVSKTCIPPGSVIILAEEVNSGEIIRGDVDISTITSIKVISTTWKLYLEEAPEAFEVVAYDSEGNTFSTLEGIPFSWTIENVDSNIENENLVTMVRWRDTDYEAPHGIAELENEGHKSYSVLLYGQAMGEARVTACLGRICTGFSLHVVASVVLTPATAVIAPGDTLRYRVVRARAGRLTVQDVADTLYYMKLPDDNVALLEDAVSLVRGTAVGSTPVYLMSGANEVATAVLSVSKPHSIKVSLRPSHLVVRGEEFITHCVVLDGDGRALTSGDEILIRLTVAGNANVELLRSNDNGTLTDGLPRQSGEFTVTAILYSIAGRALSYRVEGQTTGVAVEPLQVVPPELYISWTGTLQEVTLEHIGGGSEAVQWSEQDGDRGDGGIGAALSLSHAGVVTVRAVGDLTARVQLKKYPHIRATGRVIVAPPEYLQVWSTGQARVGRPHHLHVTLTAVHPATGEFYNFHKCNCGSFTVSLLEGPEPYNITAAPWVTPIEGACCALEVRWEARGVATLRVAGARVADTCRVSVRAAPRLLWPPHAAALISATLPVLAQGEALLPQSKDARAAELLLRDGPPPLKHPDVQLFTLKCRKKGETTLKLTSQSVDEDETVDFDVACASHVSKIRLEPPEPPGNCSGAKLWLRPGHDVKVKVTLLDAIGRELLDEKGPKVKWEISPSNKGIELRALDRLFIENHPDYAPVPVPYKYYQVFAADERAIGWSGTITASIPDATVSIQARVVAPLKCDSTQVHIAWEGEAVTEVATVSGGSGRYAATGPTGVTAGAEGGRVHAVVPGPGVYDLLLTDLCLANEKLYLEVHVEEVIRVEVSTARAVCAGTCVALAAVARGRSGRALAGRRAAEWRVGGAVQVRDGALCGERAGSGAVRAALAGVWSADWEVIVFPPLSVVPTPARLPVGARLQLRHDGGPPPHLATLHYETVDGARYADVSQSGLVVGVTFGNARVRLTARDVANVEMASADADVEVVPVSGLRVHSATQNLLVGAPCPLWLESEGLGPSVLAGLSPSPRVTWTVREPTSARLIATHADDMLERSVAEGLAVRVIPMKAGLVTIDVRVRNMGKIAESRTWESTVEILAIRDVATSVEGAPGEVGGGARLAVATGAAVRLRAAPRGQWRAVAGAAAEVTPAGELRAVRPGHAVLVAHHRDDRSDVYREAIVHVEVGTPHYCTVEPSGDEAEAAVRVVLRSALGRPLLAPDAAVAAYPPLAGHARPHAHSALGNELVLTGLDATGMFMSFQATVGSVILNDEIWVTGSDTQADRVFACGGWAVCVEGGGWRGPPALALREGAGVTLALLLQDAAGRHVLRAERPQRVYTVHQLPLGKMEFMPGEWPSSMVPLSIEAAGLTSGPVLCTEEQKLALEGVTVDLPFTCRTQAPHTAYAILDLNKSQIGCSISPANPITDASEVEVCAEWGSSRACTRTTLLPLIRVSPTKVSLLTQPAVFTVYGHRRALSLLKITSSPGLRVQVETKLDGEMTVTVKSEVSTCGFGWVGVASRLTAQDVRVEVERECDATCGSLLGAILAIIAPYMSTLITAAAITAASLYVYTKMCQKSVIRQPMQPPQTVLPPMEASPSLNRSTWSRSPYASNGPVTPIYGDASVLPPDQTFSPNSTRTHSRFL